MDNEEFKRRVRMGELEKRKVFGELYREEYAYLRRWAERLLRGRQHGRRPLDADDLIQEVFVSFFDTCDEFEGRASLRTYLFQAIRHRAMDNARASPVTMVSTTGSEDVNDPLRSVAANSNPEASVAAKRCMEKVLPALERAHDRETLLTYELIIVEGRTYADLSTLLGASQQSLRQRVSAAMRTLQALIEKLCGGLP
jgi:RNA polymerase sigma factor (sigma-70 family)